MCVHDIFIYVMDMVSKGGRKNTPVFSWGEFWLMLPHGLLREKTGEEIRSNSPESKLQVHFIHHILLFVIKHNGHFFCYLSQYLNLKRVTLKS